MIATAMRQFVRIIATATGLALAFETPALGADASPWDNDARSGLRLIAGAASDNANTTLRAGVEIRLSKGWKTYWRYPGDSGVPPRFDFGQSKNVKSVAVLWPAPRRISDDSGTSIGYKDGVTFPLRIVPEEPSKPVLLHLKLDYAVCETLCIPAEGKAELMLSGAPSMLEPALAAAEARVPKSVALGEGSVLAIRAVRREKGRPRIVVDATAPGSQPAELFAEGPTPDWALPVPEPIASEETGLRQFAFALDGVPAEAKGDSALIRLTLVSGGAAIEVTTHLD